MATSGETDYTRTGGQIITAAARILGKKAEAQALDTYFMESALEALNMWVKNAMGSGKRVYRGLKIWQRQRATLTLSAKIAFALQATGGDLDIDPPVKIINAVRRNTDDADDPMTEMILDEYDAIGNKTDTGTPTMWMYERQVAAASVSGVNRGLFSLNRIPSDTTDTIVLTYLRPLENFDDQDNDCDFPQQWFRPLKWIMACELAPEVGEIITEDMKVNKAEAIELAASFYTDRSKQFFQPYK